MKFNLQKLPSKLHLPQIALVIFVFLSSCNKKEKAQNLESIDEVLKFKDTQLQDTSYLKKLDSIRPSIPNDDFERLNLYYFVKHSYYQKRNLSNLSLRYADSSLTQFQNDKRVSDYKKEYFRALLMKGDAIYITKRYNRAVSYYLQARAFRRKYLDSCYSKDLSERIGNIYFIQQRFTLAAQYFKVNYQLLLTCPIDADTVKREANILTALNTIGYCYERSNLLDSALTYYRKNLTYLAQSKAKNRMPNRLHDDIFAVTADNLGSIYLKKRQFQQAEQLLLQCINLKYSGGDDFQVPPLIKLGELYTLTGNYQKARSSFYKADSLLAKKYVIEFALRWHEKISDFFAAQGDFKSAHLHLNNATELKSKMSVEQDKLSTIDFEKEFAGLEQRFHVRDVEKKSAIQRIYLVSAALLLLCISIIAFLLYRYGKQVKKNHQQSQLNNEQLKTALADVEDANKKYVRVMKIMAHDLRNPLNGISGLASLLLDNPKAKDTDRESFTLIKDSAQHATNLINELLDAVMNNKQENEILEREVFDIRVLLYQCVSLLSFKAAEKNQKLIIKPIKNIDLPVYANREKLWRVFSNIIVNAIKFSYEDSQIEIALKRINQAVVISICDRGIGIPPEMNDYLFDMFTDAKRTGTSGEKPYGLGLSISKQIISAHGGKIWHEPNPEGGTIFYIQLPV